LVSKADQLKMKIDSLMSIFSASAQPALTIVGDTEVRAVIPDHHEPRGRTSPSLGRSSSGTTANASGQTVLTPGTGAFGSSTGSPADNFVCPYEPTLPEAEENLNIFITKQLKYFPFVYISPTTTAEQLRQERPFLWLCIMAISSKIIAQQQSLNKRIENIVAQRLLYESEYSLDLLLGILAFIGWYETPEPVN
jgi:hypothetical protein